jgi:hypothetical protein
MEPTLRDTPERDAAFEGGCSGSLDDVGVLPGCEDDGAGFSVAIGVGSSEEGSLPYGPADETGGAGAAGFEEPGDEPEETTEAGVGSGEEGSLPDGPAEETGGAGAVSFEGPRAGPEETAGAGTGGAGLLGAGAGTGAGDEGSHEVSTGGAAVLWT